MHPFHICDNYQSKVMIAENIWMMFLWTDGEESLRSPYSGAGWDNFPHGFLSVSGKGPKNRGDSASAGCGQSHLLLPPSTLSDSIEQSLDKRANQIGFTGQISPCAHSSRSSQDECHC